MNKWVLIILSLVILGAIFFFATNQAAQKKTEKNKPATMEKSPSTMQKNEQTTTEVVYTDTGFSPKELSIKPGTTVTFTNNSKKQMWVASNPHPIHIEYSKFDQKSVGDTYSFTFTEKRVYRYHNHLSPGDGGVITVE